MSEVSSGIYKAKRQWNLFKILLETGEEYSASKLHELNLKQMNGQCEWSLKTTRRDLKGLMASGLPIGSKKKGRKTVYFLQKSALLKASVNVSFEQLLLLYLARNMLGQIEGTIYQRALDDLIDRIEECMPDEVGKVLKTYQSALSSMYCAGPALNKAEDIIESLHEAIARKIPVKISYEAISTGELTYREVEPYLIVFKNGRFYLVGHCRRRNAVRFFAINRIKVLVKSHGQPYEIPKDLNKKIDLTFGVFQGEKIDVEIKFNSDAAKYLKETVWHPTQQLEDQPDGSVLFRARMPDTVQLKAWILSWGAVAKVLKPDHLRDEVISELEACIQNYS
ncbi:MAG: WYL domain-containing protein [Thermodesulfobacteria bacterium]|nr:WYL domain-containing protein [Thermodesulfobacteriota bacterium]